MGPATENQPMQKQLGGYANIVFFDVETNVPGRAFPSYELLEFGAVILDARSLSELGSFHTLIRPAHLSCIDRRTSECNTITASSVIDAPTFQDVADDIYQLLEGHMWAGHNIMKFDILRVNEAFSKIGRQPPQPSGIIDTYPLLRKTFGKRAGDFKLASLANYCGFGKQEHRSIADVRLNIDVLRSCATMLFLESNYPDMFRAQVEVISNTSVLEQCTSFSPVSPRSGLSLDIDKKLEFLQSSFTDQVISIASGYRSADQSSDFITQRLDFSSEELERVGSLRTSGLSLPFSELCLNSTHTVRKNVFSTSERKADSGCSHVVAEAEKHILPKLVEVTSISNINQVEDALIVHGNSNPVEVMDVKSEKVEELINLTDPLLSNDSTLTESGYQNCEENKMEEGLLHSISSMSLQTDSKNPLVYDAKVSEIKSSSIPNVNTSSLMKFDATPFLLASHVNLSSIEVQEKTYSYGSATMLFYEGFPLHLLDFKVRVRFTVNESYAFDDKGRPRFSIAVEPSEAACNVIRKCEDLVRSKAAFNHEVEWLPALKEESGCFMTRMSIGTKQVEGHSIYTTEFYRSSSSGLKALSLGPLHVSSFKSALPHGSIIDAGFGFYVFNFNNRSGVRISAKHITIY